MKSTSIAHLIKIGNKTHIESLRDNGLVFMNTISYFKEIEADEEIVSVLKMIKQ